MKKPRIAILGTGNMATALACHLAELGHKTQLYGIETDVIKQINTRHANPRYLPGVRLPANITASADLAECVHDARFIIAALPSAVCAQVLEQAWPYLRQDAIIALTTKGFDTRTLQPMAVQISHGLPKNWGKRVCMLGGPAVATEMAKGTPMALAIASSDIKAAREVARLMTGRGVKAAVSDDLLGVSLAGALKNAYAIALGLCDGLGYDTNTQAFVVTLAISEMAEVMIKAGAHPKTAPSLAGLGDLLVTGLSPHGHNRRYGERLVRARTHDPHRLGLTTVEGITATELGLKLAKRLKAKTPLLATISHCLHAKRDFARPFVDYLKNIKLDVI